MDSILETTKKVLGIAGEYTQFDVDITLHINSVLAILSQLGIGPEEGFSITGNTENWSDFLPKGSRLEAAKTYVCLKVRLLFDPPQSGAVIECIERQLGELEWRLTAEASGSD